MVVSLKLKWYINILIMLLIIFSKLHLNTSNVCYGKWLTFEHWFCHIELSVAFWKVLFSTCVTNINKICYNLVLCFMDYFTICDTIYINGNIYNIFKSKCFMLNIKNIDLLLGINNFLIWFFFNAAIFLFFWCCFIKLIFKRFLIFIDFY